MTSDEDAGTPEWPVVCSACGAPLGGLPSGEPCPDCGETARTHLISVQDTVHLTDSATAAVTYVKDRPWQEQWRAVLKDLGDLEDAATRKADPPPDWRQLPIRFCEDCWHLKDWLRNDPAAPEAARRSADKHAREHPAIALAGDVANTNKHRSRKPGERTARIAGGTVSEEAAVFHIEWTEPDETTGTADALTTARQAVQEWRDFLATHALDESAA